MKIYSIETGLFKLDGGAMFGVVPKTIWQNINPPDSNNLCNWALRSMLIEDGNRLILIDNGIGTKQDAKFFSHYYLSGNDTLEKSLACHGFHPDDITDMFLTHLHFDHCGGSIKYNKDKTGYETAFKNATYWSNKDHWKWATEPNPREKASFLKENILPIQESGQLKFVEKQGELFPGFSVMYANGHTDAMMIPHIQYKEKTIVYMADLLPSTGHIPLPYVMAYDTRPLITLQEKSEFLKHAADNNYILFFEHDAIHECCTLKHTEKGIRLNNSFSFKEAFGE
ncbi:MAG: MBL fold metallo-hydrolase [Bacteroidetes bacterium]|nr:MBL fold metallo-hydrolase [Bacteroidota bacterium]HET6243062.1 MBL fold metallo-hydrolase [Bacteroidia bacterium]